MPSDTLPSLLADLERAAADADRNAGRSVLEDIRAEVNAVRPEEKALLDRSIHALDSTELDEAGRSRVRELARLLATIDIARSGLVVTGAMFAAGTGGESAQQLQQSASELADRERELATLASDAAPALSGVQLPPRIAVVDTDGPNEPQPKGEPGGNTIEITATVANVGDSPANGVSVSADSEAAVSPTSTQPGTLAGGGRASQAFAVEDDTAGEFTVEVTADSANAGTDTESASVEILAKVGAIEAARTSLGEILDGLGEGDLPRGLRKSLRAKLEIADEKLQLAKSVASGESQDRGRGQDDDDDRGWDRDDDDDVDDLLKTAALILGAALNQLDVLDGEFDPDEFDDDRRDRGDEDRERRGRRGADGDEPERLAEFHRRVSLLEQAVAGVIEQIGLARDARR